MLTTATLIAAVTAGALAIRFATSALALLRHDRAEKKRP